jgi:hypothetical protein
MRVNISMVNWCHKVVTTPHIPSYVTFINCRLMWPSSCDHYHPLRKTSFMWKHKKLSCVFIISCILFCFLFWFGYHITIICFYIDIFFYILQYFQSCAFHMIIYCFIVKCFCVVVHVCAFTQFMYFLCFMVCIICFNNFFWIFIYVNSWLCLHLCFTSCCYATCFMLLCHLCYVCYL